ncbi:Tyrosine--tRNA ligase [Kluyvera cryocrescens]|uniref:Tyrosine--tRNA ligase n=1 Tax=Kluyvera cryocrescens TaxID=580 RepID=A0A485A9U2_KLUCR|nr:Tyrosine--tRNA ligase [Kluyvera cryocrescens]
MASSNLIKQLQERGLVAQVTDEVALAERLAQGRSRSIAASIQPLTACIWGILFLCYA